MFFLATTAHHALSGLTHHFLCSLQNNTQTFRLEMKIREEELEAVRNLIDLGSKFQNKFLKSYNFQKTIASKVPEETISSWEDSVWPSTENRHVTIASHVLPKSLSSEHPLWGTTCEFSSRTLGSLLRVELYWSERESESDIAWNGYIDFSVVCLHWVAMSSDKDQREFSLSPQYNSTLTTIWGTGDYYYDLRQCRNKMFQWHWK